MRPSETGNKFENSFVNFPTTKSCLTSFKQAIYL